MQLEGGCQCGDVRYVVEGEPRFSALCHCADCRKSAGAPVVAWAAIAEADFKLVQGEAVTFNSSAQAQRSFCPRCGTGLWYRNAEMMPGIVDIQVATLDDPDALVPKVQVQLAERIGWMAHAHELPGFERFPAD